jgi:hypothetical protein
MVKIECICPPRADGTERHPDGDTVTLRERLDFRAALAARNSIVMLKNEDPDATSGDILATLTETYLLGGVESWSLVDERGKPVEVSRTAIRERLLSHVDAAMIVGDAADELYAASVILPLLKRAQDSSPPTPTSASTSATMAPSPKRPKPSKRSSITTIPTAATATTSPSPDGDSNSLPNSA